MWVLDRIPWSVARSRSRREVESNDFYIAKASLEVLKVLAKMASFRCIELGKLSQQAIASRFYHLVSVFIRTQPTVGEAFDT